MAIKTYNDQNFVAIANAIRAKNGETTQYKPSEMAPAIMAIESGLELLPQDTVAGAIANFPDGSNNYPVVELIANIEPKQSGSGDPSPSNVRPISGSTECKVVRAGKNLWEFGDKTLPETIGYIILNCSNPIPAGTYRVSTSIISTSDYCHMRFRRADGSAITQISFRANQGRVVYSLELTEPAYKVYLYSSTQSPGYTTSWSDIQIEVGTAATDYEPYQAPEVKTISWESEAGTVYGGTLNVTTGELTVTHKLVTYTGAESESWTYEPISGNSRFRTIVPDVKISSAGRNQVISNIGNFSASINAPFVIFIYSNGANKLLYYYPGNDITTAEDFKTWLSSNNMQVVYELNTPETYQLTPEEVKTLLGVNNIYADTGNVEVTYRADIDLYIAKKIAEGA